MSPAAPLDPETGLPAGDNTVDVDSLNEGTLAYLYGREPVIVFSTNDDGSIEVARFGALEHVQAADLAALRGPKPAGETAVAGSPDDRIAMLEAKIDKLMTLLAAGQAAATPPPAAAAAPPEPPAEPAAAPVPAAQPDPVTLFAPAQPVAPPAAPAAEDPSAGGASGE